MNPMTPSESLKKTPLVSIASEGSGSHTLYVVSTPIGNLSDIMYRAIEVLHNVDLIGCEDTRKSRTLLRRYNVSTQIMSIHKFSEARKTRLILRRLEQGENVALISDAGTPAVSDPGSKLVRAVIDAGFSVIPIPGPSAILAALCVSGMDGSSFTYLGFAPRKDDERRRFFSEILIAERTCVFFETGKRVVATLLLASEVLGDARIMVVRELTKIHEEKLHGTAREILDILEQRDSIRGEITVVVEQCDTSTEEVDLESVVNILMNEGFSGKRLADEARKRFGVRKSDAYGKFLEIKADS